MFDRLDNDYKNIQKIASNRRGYVEKTGFCKCRLQARLSQKIHITLSFFTILLLNKGSLFLQGVIIMAIDLESAKIKASLIDTNGDKEITLTEVLEANKNGKNRVAYKDFEQLKTDPEKLKNLASDTYEKIGYKFADNVFSDLHDLAINNKLPHKTKSESKPISI